MNVVCKGLRLSTMLEKVTFGSRTPFPPPAASPCSEIKSVLQPNGVGGVVQLPVRVTVVLCPMGQAVGEKLVNWNVWFS